MLMQIWKMFACASFEVDPLMFAETQASCSDICFKPAGVCGGMAGEGGGGGKWLKGNAGGDAYRRTHVFVFAGRRHARSKSFCLLLVFARDTEMSDDKTRENENNDDEWRDEWQGVNQMSDDDNQQLSIFVSACECLCVLLILKIMIFLWSPGRYGNYSSWKMWTRLQREA